MPASPEIARCARPGRRAGRSRVLVIGCGALARELVALTRQAGPDEVDLTCLPASLHNRPERIPAAVRARIRAGAGDGHDADLRRLCRLRDRRAPRPGPRGGGRRAARRRPLLRGLRRAGRLRGARRGGARHVLPDRLPRPQLRAARHPRPRPRPAPGAAADVYFGNYRRVVYLAQTDDPALTEAAGAAPGGSACAFERRFTGLGELATSMRSALELAAAGPDRARGGRGSLRMAHAHRHLVARHPGPGRGQGPARANKVVLHPALPGRDRQGGQPGRQGSYGRLHRGVATESRGRAATTSRPRRAAEAARLEADYTKEVLAQLVQSGGLDGGPALPPAHDETPGTKVDA